MPLSNHEKAEATATKELAEALNERPEVLRVLYKRGMEVATIRGDWNVQVGYRGKGRADINDDYLLSIYRQAINSNPDIPPLVVWNMPGESAGRRRLVRHVVCMVPLTVLLERLALPGSAESPWGT